MAGDPSDIGGAPISVFVFKIEYPFRRDMGLQQIPGSSMHYALWLTGCARCVEDKERVLAIKFLGGTMAIDSLDHLVPPVIATNLHVYGRPGSPDHNASLNPRSLFEGLIN